MGGTKRSGNRIGMIIVDPSGGLSGDMFLAGLCALGAPAGDIETQVSTLPGLEPFRIVVGRVKRRGIAAWRARVKCPGETKARNLKSILSMIKRSHLAPRVKGMAARTFEILGEVEGRIHGMPAGDVHFHEVGAVDSIVDIVGAAVAIAILDFPMVYHRPFRLGAGMVEIAHGTLPVPAPATLEVLRGRKVQFGTEPGEVVTPTGAALMAALGLELPLARTVTPTTVVYATGTREPAESAGILRMIAAEAPPEERTVTVLRTTIDDMNPEHFGHLRKLLFESGALDVYLTQLIMKKGRPGVLVTVLCETGVQQRILDLLFRETTTLGVRIAVEEREELERWVMEVSTPFGTVQVKCGRLPDGTVKRAPEYESCSRAALARSVPVGTVFNAALRAAEGEDGAARAGGKRRKRR